MNQRSDTTALQLPADFRAVQVDLHVGTSVEKVSGAFYGSAVRRRPCLWCRSAKGVPLGDGLADNRVVQAMGCLGVDSCREAVVHIDIPPPARSSHASTRPSQEPPRLGDVHGFRRPKSERDSRVCRTAAQESGVNLDFFRGEPGNLSHLLARSTVSIAAGQISQTVSGGDHDAVQRFLMAWAR